MSIKTTRLAWSVALIPGLAGTASAIDWSVGTSRALPGDFSIDLKYADTDVDGTDSSVFAALTKSF